MKIYSKLQNYYNGHEHIKTFDFFYIYIFFLILNFEHQIYELGNILIFSFSFLQRS